MNNLCVKFGCHISSNNRDKQGGGIRPQALSVSNHPGQMGLSCQRAVNRQSSCLFILARKRKQTTLYSALMAAMLELCITKNSLKLSFPVCEVPLSIPVCPILNHGVLSFCRLIQSNSLPLLVLQSRMGGDKSKTGACRKHSFPRTHHNGTLRDQKCFIFFLLFLVLVLFAVLVLASICTHMCRCLCTQGLL